MANMRILKVVTLVALALSFISSTNSQQEYSDLSRSEISLWDYSAHEMNPLTFVFAARLQRKLQEVGSHLSQLARSTIHRLRGSTPREPAFVEREGESTTGPARRNLFECAESPANISEDVVMGLPIRAILDATPVLGSLEYIGEKCTSVPGDYDNSTGTKNLCVNGKLMGLWRHDPKQVYGAWSADIKCPNQGNTSGLVTTLYTTSDFNVGSQDEIDFEFLNRYNTVLQINTWANGQSVFFRNVYLGFDCAERAHNYAVFWSKEVLIFYVDYQVVAWYPNTEAIGGKAFPHKPSYVVGSFWDGSGFNANAEKWCGPRDQSTLGTEMIATYSNIKVTVPIVSAMCWWNYIWPPA